MLGEEGKRHNSMEVMLFMDSVRLAYLAGVKVGSESLVKGLEKVAEKNGNNIPIEFIKLVSHNTVNDVELRLSKMECGQDLLNTLNESRQ